MSTADIVLEVQGLDVTFQIGRGRRSAARRLKAVDEVSLQIRRGEVLAIVGESGCGKTTLARALLGLQMPSAGEVLLEGKPIAGFDRRSIARLMQPIFQDPYSSLNPRKTIGSIIALPLIVQNEGNSASRRQHVTEMMELVGLPARLIHAYPSQLSGGQRQRVAIARALITRPSLVVCDEPTSALDVSVQAQILNLLQDLQERFELTYVFISHNLSVVEHMADRLAVMYLGRIVESGPAEDVFAGARHPYTRMLLGAALRPDPERGLPAFEDDRGLPDPTAPPSGCHFHPRCPIAEAVCASEKPARVRIGDTEVACHLADGRPA